MNTQKLTIITAVVAALIALGGYFFIQSNKPATVGENVVGKINLTGQPSVGEKDAPVKVVVFEDFKCPACKYFEERNLPKLKMDYIETGKVEFYFINFPFIGPDSTTAAIASECVYEQSEDSFWEYKTVLFRSQQDESKIWATPEFLTKLAQEYVPDVDTVKMRTCIDEKRYSKDVQNDLDMGRNAGVQGTPSVYVDGDLIQNSNNYELISKAIEAALKK